MNEYEPKGFTAESTVSNLAHDFVQMIRCRQMMEALQRPKPLAQKEMKDWELMQRNEEIHQMYSDAIACIVTSEDLSFPTDAARMLAKNVMTFVESTIEAIEEINNYDEEGRPQVDFTNPIGHGQANFFEVGMEKLDVIDPDNAEPIHNLDDLDPFDPD